MKWRWPLTTVVCLAIVLVVPWLGPVLVGPQGDFVFWQSCTI